MRFILLMGVLFTASQVYAQNKLSFEEALSVSLNRSEDIQAKQSELRSSGALLTQSKFRFLPDFGGYGTYNEAGTDVNNRSVTRTYGLQSNLNLFRFGADYYGYKSADTFYDGAFWDLKSTTLSLEETVAIKILDVISRQQETQIRRKLMDAQKQYSSVAEKRYAKGILPRQELDKVTIDTRIAEARLKDAELAEYQALQSLRVYAGDIVLDTDWPWLKSLRTVAKRNFKFNVHNHPQWKYLKNKSLSAEYYLSSKSAEIWPSLDMSLSYQNQQSPFINNNDWQTQWGGTLTLTIPLFSRWESKTAQKLAFESQVRADLILQKTGHELEALWNIAETDFRVQLESAVTREQTLKISRSLYQDNFHRFQAGRSSANDLFNDQDRLYQTELLAIQGWYAAHVSYVKLCHSLGLLTTECHL